MKERERLLGAHRAYYREVVKVSRDSAAERQRRIGSVDTPHGTANGYNNYGCRCDPCKAAKQSEGRMIREQRRAGASPDKLPHGSPNGYSQWGCRCAPCIEAASRRTVRRSAAKNARTQERARHSGKQWTGPELETALRSDLTAMEAAGMLGRSFYAVEAARRRSLHDPRYIDLAGL